MDKKEENLAAAGEALLQELNAYEENGCEICLNGRPTHPERIVNACIYEKHRYMRDITCDSMQRVKKINFIRLWDDDENKEEPQRRPAKRPRQKR